MRGRKGGGVEAKGKGDLRSEGTRERSGAATKRRERKRAEKGDEREERSETGVRGGTFTGHLEFAAPTRRWH